MSDIVYTIKAHPEDEGPEGSFASGDDVADKAMCDDIRRRAESGDVWAWCYVVVTAEVTIDGQTFRGTDSLGGCCSYASEADFTTSDGYYPDMKNEAKRDLIRSLRDAVDRGDVARKVLARIE